MGKIIALEAIGIERKHCNVVLALDEDEKVVALLVLNANNTRWVLDGSTQPVPLNESNYLCCGECNFETKKWMPTPMEPGMRRRNWIGVIREDKAHAIRQMIPDRNPQEL